VHAFITAINQLQLAQNADVSFKIYKEKSSDAPNPYVAPGLSPTAMLEIFSQAAL